MEQQPSALFAMACTDINAFNESVRTGQPLELRNLVSGWRACREWRGQQGIDNMRALCKDVDECQVMCSCSDIFLGDLAQHQPASMRLHEFLGEARRALQGQAGPHLYLAQHPLGADGLATALGPPPLLPAASLSSTNLWMCVRGSRSNIHHDPHHNLLCVVVGSKRVTLYPPALTPCLYPAPLAGDASNHSCVDFAAPDLVRHPLFRLVMRCSSLRAGGIRWTAAG
ncbi:hypothetical protein V8C86DRAFT_1109478 [Haematococcus lacustris]